MRQVGSINIGDCGIRELEELYGKLCGKKSGFFHVRSSSQKCQFGFGSDISDGDIIIVKGCVISEPVSFISLGKNIKIIFMNCSIEKGLEIDLDSRDNSRNKVGFFYCDFIGDVRIRASKVELFRTCLDDKDSRINIRSNITCFKYNKLNQGQLELTSERIMLEDDSILLEKLGITSGEEFIRDNDTEYSINSRKLEVRRIV